MNLAMICPPVFTNHYYHSALHLSTGEWRKRLVIRDNRKSRQQKRIGDGSCVTVPIVTCFCSSEASPDASAAPPLPVSSCFPVFRFFSSCFLNNDIVRYPGFYPVRISLADGCRVILAGIAKPKSKSCSGITSNGKTGQIIMSVSSLPQYGHTSGTVSDLNVLPHPSFCGLHKKV